MGKGLPYILSRIKKQKAIETYTNNVPQQILFAYDYDYWNNYSIKKPVFVDISSQKNSHILLVGLSGSGKSYALIRCIREIIQSGTPQDEYFFSDFKQDDLFSYLRKCKNYYPYQKTLTALNQVYERLQKRQSGEDTSRNGITLIIDEYVSFILSLQNKDKKKATEAMNKISEILMLGRSLSIRIIIAVQRPDANIFSQGARINFGVICVLGTALKSSYEMVVPSEFINEIGDRKFKTGEGILLLQGADLHFIKIPIVRDIETLQNICIKALS